MSGRTELVHEEEATVDVDLVVRAEGQLVGHARAPRAVPPEVTVQQGVDLGDQLDLLEEHAVPVLEPFAPPTGSAVRDVDREVRADDRHLVEQQW